VATYGVRLHRSDTLGLQVHPGACTEETFAEWSQQRIDSGFRLAADLFAGAGGLSLGIEQAGWVVAASVDNDVRAVETHRASFPGLALDADLSSAGGRARVVSILGQTTIDLIAGGPPCQPFSRAGRSKIRSLVKDGAWGPDDDRKELWRAFLEIVLRVRPRAALMENVPDMALTDDFLIVRTIVHELESVGYHTQVRLVDAWKYGVPQHRKRLMILARRDVARFPWPDDQPQVSLRDAIGDLPVLADDDPVGARRLPYTEPDQLSEFAALMRKGAESGVIWDHMTRPVRADDRDVFERMDSRTLYSEIPASLRRYTAETFDDKYKRLDWNDLSRSITAHIAKDGYWYIHPELHRTLTVREAARIQTFPDHHRFAGTRSDAFRQIGNAVPPRLGEAAASALAPEAGVATPASAHPQSRWHEARQYLAEWARQQRRGPSWFAFPGPNVTPAVAVVVAILSTGRAQLGDLATALDLIRGYGKLTSRDVSDLLEALDGVKTAQGLADLRCLTRKQKIWAEPDELAEELRLLPAETALLHLLSGQDVMLTSQISLRVAARVAGSKSGEVNRLTDGRVDLARLVGAGSEAPLRMAALRIIGMTLCLPNKRHCDRCPLAQWCSSTSSRPGPTAS
jgi:DNA (cytosine-5)-methyltransferase 1